MLFAFAGCAKDNTDGVVTSSQETSDAQKDDRVIFSAGGESEYSFVYSDADNTERGVDIILSFRMTLRRAARDGDFKINKFGNDSSVDHSVKEVLIGLTDRKESAELLSVLPNDSFAIEVTENKIVIVASRDRILEDALSYFEEHYLVEDAEGNIVMQKGRYISPAIEYKVSPMISSKEGYSTLHELLYEIPATGDNKIMQGGCSDGEHMYFCLVNSGSPQYAYVYKYSIETGKLVKKSELLDTDHSNDMTYNPNTGELIVLHNSPRNSILSVLDPETLEKKREIQVVFNMFSIDYQPDRNVYVVGISGGQNFSILNENFQISREYIPSGSRFEVNSTGYVTQGVVCDKEYIYFVQYKENVIVVYDWTGAFVNKIPLSIPANIEPENISIVDDSFYIGCNNSSWSGGLLYRVKLNIPE